MSLIRIATRAWNGGASADTREDATVGVRFPWVEIDGHRFTDVIEADAHVEQGLTTVTIKFGAAVEAVLLDSDGNELRV